MPQNQGSSPPLPAIASATAGPSPAKASATAGPSSRRSLSEGGQPIVSPKKHMSLFLVIALIALLAVSTASISFIYYSKSRTPSPVSRASSNASPTLALPSSNIQLPTSNNNKSGFGSIISKSPFTSPDPEFESGEGGPTTPSTPTSPISPTTILPKPPPADLKPLVVQIKAEGGKFTPNQISVRYGQVLTMKIQAEDKDYDINIPDFGLSQYVPAGQTRIIEFQVNGIGQYIFSCLSSCGSDPQSRGIITAFPN